MYTFVECLLKTGKWIETFSEIQMLVEEFQQNSLVSFERLTFIERSESGFLNGWGRILPTFIDGSEKWVCHEK